VAGPFGAGTGWYLLAFYAMDFGFLKFSPSKQLIGLDEVAAP
jgi:hypothetical protein